MRGDSLELKAIGIIHSSYKTKEEAPRQGRLSDNTQEIEIYPEFFDGLKGIEDVSHVILLYWFHKANRNTLQSRPPVDPDNVRGVFTSRSPNRPNPIAFTVAEIINVDGNRIKIKGIEALDGTPLLDIKMYSPEIDCVEQAKVGWLNQENQPRH